MRRRWKGLIVIFAALVLFFAGRGLVRARERRLERQMKIQPLIQLKLAPLAFGRFVIDLPEGVRLVNWSQTFQGTGPIRVAKGGTPEQFKQTVEQRAEELRTQRHEDGGPLLEKVVDLGLPHAQALTYWKDEWELKTTFIECDAFYLKNGSIYRFKNTIDLDPADQKEYFHDFKQMLQAIQPRRPEEIPTLSGSCFDDAILLDGPDRDFSDIVMVTGVWPDRPDVRFQLVVMDNGPFPDPQLLDRLARANALHGSGVLRSRDRNIGPIPGQEHLERVEEKNGTQGHLFIWEAQGEANQWRSPQIRVEMTTGEGQHAPQDTSLSDEDALTLWDKILDSLRWRPSSNPPPFFGGGRKRSPDSGSPDQPAPAYYVAPPPRPDPFTFTLQLPPRPSPKK